MRIAELVPGRGPLAEPEATKVKAMADELLGSNIAHVLSITDNAGGAPKIYPESLGLLLGDRRKQAIIHLSCKDLNRAGLESRAWSLAAAGFESLLCLSGDYPVDGYRGYADPTFDVDSVGLIQMLHEMNQGMPVPNMKGELVPLPKTDFYLGCAVSPFKQQERELMPQYFKLARKIAVGAEFVITQLGYDSRKFDELIRYMRLKGLNVPVMANIYLLSRPVARFFNRGNVAGVFCSDELKAECEKQAASPDKGKKFFQEFAAKQIAILKGLGYRGAYLAGPRNAQEFSTIFELADSYGPDDWKEFAKEIQYPQPNEFYYFEQDPETKLSSGEINRQYQASLTPEGRKRARSRAPLAYKFSRFVHSVLFDPRSRGFSMMRDFYLRIDNSPGAKRFFHVLEQAAKVPLYNCKDCGDCSLVDVAYLCPMSQCAKNQRNGPCGGSAHGRCEFFKDKDCIWARAYDRLKGYGEEEDAFKGPTVYRNGALRGESPWANNFLGRDHFGYKPVPKE
ncbi:MAG: methylenetetrahydrofolate reductase C-terminal domain-containing protein [Chloroflexota bacterium]